ncbi:DUF226 domain-containing protein [Borrelia crocidurae]|uniref:Plasmid partitioning associated protein-1 n=1 Tax=Borrelia crocidurae (strain Achema) TaxID=1155096 RepID=I0FFG2_BORCA|nr:DUF226 domain-containing protein [Borrelia crocidurae]AFI32218.1 Plasmid partitioning associated protein-1 [Borrelia crocidurae str. Achema]
MDSVLERLREKKIEIKEKRDKSIFVKIENKNDRMLYHTKIMKDLYVFESNRNNKSKFFISFRELFNQEKIESFHLFPIKEKDKFLGIFYGYSKPIKNVVRRYEENGIMKASTFSIVYYIEFRFKKGSIFCYLRGFSYLLRKDKVGTKYYNALIEKLSTLEIQVYEFYDKKLSDGGFISKWIKKRQK